MHETHERTGEFKKSSAYEQLLTGLNATLSAAPLPEARVPTRPLLFIVGPPRSGTTLLYQSLAATGAFGYPSNVVARFHRAPWLGARIQRALEPLLERPPPAFHSRAGHTDHWSGPHEFGYFWERHFPFAEHHEPAPARLAGGLESLARELGWLEDAFEAPLLFKSVILDFVVEQLAAALPSAVFLYTKRAPLQVASSILRMRRQFYGTANAWFSVRPRRAHEFERRASAEQIAYQLAAIDQALTRARASLDARRCCEVDYQRFCARPRETVAELLSRWEIGGATLTNIPETFKRRPPAPDDHDELELAAALEAAGVQRAH